MTGKDLTILAAALASGSISAVAIEEMYGEGILGDVLAIAGGSVVGAATTGLLETVDKHTGIISDVGGLVDDIWSIF